MLDTTLTSLVHGGAKTGKSTLGGTSPKPFLTIDSEGSTRFLPLKRKVWDPLKDPMPDPAEGWDTAVIVVRDFDKPAEALRRLQTESHPFRGVTVDSITDTQRRLKESINSGPFRGFENWEELLRRLDQWTRDFRDMVEHPEYPIYTFTVIAESTEKDGKLVPKLQGSLRESLPYFFDVVGYLWQENLTDAAGSPKVVDGKTQRVSRMLTVPTDPTKEAGERVQGRLPDVINNPSISKMLVKIYPELKK